MENKVTLYIATHNITGKKYFGKTIKWFTVEDLQERYHGSGPKWVNHLKKHGDKVTMEIYQICSLNEEDDDYVKPIAIKFSMENNIVKSKEWYNQKIEDGFEGGSLPGELNPWYGKKHTEETKQKIGDGNRGKDVSEETREKLRNLRLNKPTSEETKEKISLSMIGEKNHFYGKHHTEETKEKMRGPKSPEHLKKIKEKISNYPIRICPHCSKEGKGGAMTRHHFDNCKHRKDHT